MSPRTAPATIAHTNPSTQEFSLSAPSTPKKQPASIIPSRPTLTTPLRSEKRPPSAANASGVANTNIRLIIWPQSTTPAPESLSCAPSRWPTLESVAP